MHSSTATPEFETIRDEALTERFECEAIPLLAAFYPQAMKMTRNRTEAEDLLQETAARAFAGFHGFRDGTNLGGWLYRILLNTHISDYRKQQRRPVQWLTDEITDGQLLAEARHSSPDCAQRRTRCWTGWATQTSGKRCSSCPRNCAPQSITQISRAAGSRRSPS